MPDVTRQHIIDAVHSLGAGRGDIILVHSSLKSFGRVDGGAAAVAEALIDCVSPAGTIVMPTFNYDQYPFDAKNTPSLTGAITEAFRNLPDAVRSLHPTHSVAAIGPLAYEICEGHEKAQPFGEGSPLWKLHQRNAWVLLIGVDHRASSMIHVAEELARVPYLDRTRIAKVVTPDGLREVAVRKPGCDFAFNRIDPLLQKRGMIFRKKVGASVLSLMRAADIVQAATELLADNPAALLCTLEDGGVCDEARRMIDRNTNVREA